MGRRLGRVEIAGRVSTMNLNNQLGTTNGVVGGQQTIYTAGLNWYVNGNIRFMFDYLHGNIAKQISPTNSGNAGARFDAFAMRTEVAF
jgi:phosphate-selective porin OprO/OprP